MYMGKEIVLRTMKSERGSDEIFGVPPQMKSKPYGFGQTKSASHISAKRNFITK